MKKVNFINLHDFEIETPEPLKKFLPSFMNRREEDIKNLKSFINEGNYSEISKIGHKLKGHGISYGFEAISLIGENLEISAKNEDLTTIKKDTENYQIIINDIRQVINY